MPIPSPTLNTTPVNRQCPVCRTWFKRSGKINTCSGTCRLAYKRARNRYHAKRKADTLRRTKRCRNCGTTYSAQIWQIYCTPHCRKLALHRTAKAQSEKQKRIPSAPYTRCYECSSAYQTSETACPVCGAVYDKKRCHEAFMRSQKSFVDIVQDNARRAGKDPKQAVRNAKLSVKTTLGVGGYADLRRRIGIWQEKRIKRPPQ